MPATIIILALLSFIISIVYLHDDPTAAFYSPQARFWELMIGSLLAYTALYRPALLDRYRNTRSIAGFLLLAGGLLLISQQRAFPGWWALLPTLGASLIISAGPTALLNQKVLSSRLFVWLGLISYPLYLWHWPIFSFLHIINGAAPTKYVKIAAIVLSIALGWLTYRLLEKPIRTNSLRIARHSSVAFPAIMVVVGSAAYYCYANNGMEGSGYRLPGKSEFAKYYENSSPDWHYLQAHNIHTEYREDCNFYDVSQFMLGKQNLAPRPALTASCYTRDAVHPKAVFIWGDSHAQHLNYGLKNQLPPAWQILQVASSGCTPDGGIGGPSAVNYCDQSNWFAMQSIRKAVPDVVLVSQSTGQSIEHFGKLYEQLKAAGVKKVVFTGPVPHWDQALPKIVLRKLWTDTPRRTFVGLDQVIYQHNSDLKQHFQGTQAMVFADLTGQFCNDQGCLVYLGDDKTTGLTAWDYGHLTLPASDFIAKNLLVKLIVGDDSTH